MRHFPTLLLTLVALLLPSGRAKAQSAALTRAVNMRSFGMKAANYSGITHIGTDRYALVSDKEEHGGFYVIKIEIDTLRGRIRSLTPLSRMSSSAAPPRDEEGICFFPTASSLFISAENDQRILEYDTLGRLTGRQLEVPQMFAPTNIEKNCGFESLTYSAADSTFYTVTERPLLSDEGAPEPLLRIAAFGNDLKYKGHYAYRMEGPSLHGKAEYYVHGVSELTSLPGGTLIVMERELSVPQHYLGAQCHIRIFAVTPDKRAETEENEDLRTLPSSRFLYKTAVADFTTHLSLSDLSFANYEGMCPGPMMHDGRSTLLLVADSQGGYGNSLYRLRDYIRLVILPPGLH